MSSVGDPSLNHLGPRIGDGRIVSRDRDGNVARRLDPSADMWEVAWWSGHRLTQDEALRGVVLADTLGTRQAWRDDDPLISVAVALSSDLGLSLVEAVELTAPVVEAAPQKRST